MLTELAATLSRGMGKNGEYLGFSEISIRSRSSSSSRGRGGEEVVVLVVGKDRIGMENKGF